MKNFLESMGINMSTLSIPQVTVPDWALILAVGVLIGAIAWRAIYHRFRAHFVRTHLRHLLKKGVIQEIHFDGDTNEVFAVDNSNERLIPAKPYKGDTVPAKHFEGITPLEVISGALKLKALAYVVSSSWSTKDNGPQHWRVKPLSTSAVMTDAPQPPRRKDERPKQAPAAASSGSNRDQRPERDQHPERDQRPEQQVSEAVH